MALATWEDVAVALGRPISTQAEQIQVDWWLSGIERIIAGRLGDVANLDQDDLLYVEVEAAVAKINRAGRGESSITVAVDDGSVTRRYENQVSAADISDELWRMLGADSGTATGSIRPGFEADTARWPVSTPPAYDPGWDPFLP